MVVYLVFKKYAFVDLLKSKYIKSDLNRFTLHLLFWFSCAVVMGIKIPVYDSYNYQVTLPERFYPNGSFDFFHFNDRLRGFSLTLISLILRKISTFLNIDNSVTTITFMAILFACITAILLPKLIKLIVPKSNEWLVSIALALFMLVFWRGYLQYLLSDIPSLFCYLIAIYLLLKPIKPYSAVIIGLFGGLAVNMRMAYLVGFICIACIFLYKTYQNKKGVGSKKRVLFSTVLLSLFMVGFLSISLPQLLINRNLLGSSSLFPVGISGGDEYVTPDGPIPLATGKLQIFQLSVGLGLQKYETRYEEGYEPKIFYMDKTGMDIVEKYLPLKDETSYLKLWLKEPINMTKINSQHVLNGFDLRYSSAYISSILAANSAGIRSDSL